MVRLGLIMLLASCTHLHQFPCLLSLTLALRLVTNIRWHHLLLLLLLLMLETTSLTLVLRSKVITRYLFQTASRYASSIVTSLLTAAAIISSALQVL